MTSHALGGRSGSAIQGPGVARPLTLETALAFGASVAVILIYGHVWYAPLTGYGRNVPGWISLAYYPAYLLALALIATRLERACQALVAAPLLLALIALASASVIWSIAPGDTIKRVVGLVFTTLAGVALASRWTWKGLTEVLAAAFAVMMVGAGAVAVLKPEWGRMQELFPGAWRGLWLEKNSLGDVMSTAAAVMLAAAIMVPGRRLMWLAMAAVAVGLMLLSTSKTALLVLIVSMAAMGFVAVARLNPAVAVAAVWAATAAVVGGLIMAIAASDLLFDILGKDATLTGRTKIWEALLHQAELRPWTGFGYGAVWDNEAQGGPLHWITAEAAFRPAHAHNGWLELLINLGWPAVILFGLWMLELWFRTIWLACSRPAGWLMAPALAAYTLVMLTESVTLNWHDMRWVIFTALAIKLVIGDGPPSPAAPTRPRRRSGARSPGPTAPSPSLSRRGP